jgi:hypothetical protein
MGYEDALRRLTARLRKHILVLVIEGCRSGQYGNDQDSYW